MQAEVSSEFLTYPEVKPKNGIAKQLIVMLHGLGSDGHDLISIVPFLQNDLTNSHFISPHGIEPFDIAPYGRQWFSLQDRSPETIKRLTLENTPKIMNIINLKQKELGLTNKETIITGFSQGTMIGLHLTLSQKEPFLAMVGFSGRLIMVPEEHLNKQTPVCLIHGLNDEIVEVKETKITEAFLKKVGIECVSLLIPNLAHSVDGSGINFAVKFLKEVINKNV